MASSHPSALTPTPQQEQLLDRFAEFVRDDVPPRQFFEQFLAAIHQLTGLSEVALWLPQLEGPWRSIVAGAEADLSEFGDVQASFAQVAERRQPQVFASTDRTAAGNLLLVPIIHNGTVLAICQAVAAQPLEQVTTKILPWVQILCDLAADYLAWQDLRRYREAAARQTAWERWTLAVHGATAWQPCADLVAQDGRALIDLDRLTVLRRHRGAWTVAAVSGVADIEPRAPELVELIRFVESLSRASLSRWTTGDALPDGQTSSHGASVWRSVQLGAIDGRQRIAIVAEQFAAAPTADQFAAWDRLAEHASVALQTSCLTSRLSRRSIWQAWMPTPGRLLFALLLVAVGGLFLLPADLIVVARGELQPEVQRECFASRSGVVQELHVTHGQSVTVGQPLVTLRDPALQLDLSRLAGERATAQSRLASVQAARITLPNTGSEGPLRARQFAAEEEELRAQLEALDRQQVLRQAEVKELVLTSPIAGRVLTWDLQQRLQSRPVERGQALLTVGAVDGPWIAELRLRPRDAGYVLKAHQEEVPVSLVLTAEPEITYQGRVRQVSDRIDADFTDDALAVQAEITTARKDFHPGAQVIAQLHCGPTSLGYKWFRDLVETVRLWWWRWVG